MASSKLACCRLVTMRKGCIEAVFRYFFQEVADGFAVMSEAGGERGMRWTGVLRS